MNRRGHKGKVDANQPEVIRHLLALGCIIQSLAPVGVGCPDLLVGYEGALCLLEVKSDGKDLNDFQRAWHKSWKGYPVFTVTSGEDATRAVVQWRNSAKKKGDKR